MYGKDFYNRVSVQQICGFFRYGSEWDPEEAGTLEEREKKHDYAFFAAVDQFREDVLAADWSHTTREQRNTQSDNLCDGIVKELAALEAIHFEAGFRAGVLLTKTCRGGL